MARARFVTRQKAASSHRASKPDVNWIPCARRLPHMGKVRSDLNKWCLLGGCYCCCPCAEKHRSCVPLPPSPELERLISLRGLIYYGKRLGRRLRKEKRELRDLVRKMDAPRRAERRAHAKYAAALSAAVRRDRRARSIESGKEEEDEEWVEEEGEEEEEEDSE